MSENFEKGPAFYIRVPDDDLLGQDDVTLSRLSPGMGSNVVVQKAETTAELQKGRIKSFFQLLFPNGTGLNAVWAPGFDDDPDFRDFEDR